MRYVKPLALAFLLVASSLFTGCGDDELKTIAKNIDRAANAIADAREVRDELYVAGLIDQREAFRVTAALLKANAALAEFKAKAETYQDQIKDGVPVEVKADLQKVAADVSAAAITLIDNGSFGVKNPEAQAKLKSAIGAFNQLALALGDLIDQIKVKPTKG